MPSVQGLAISSARGSAAACSEAGAVCSTHLGGPASVVGAGTCAGACGVPQVRAGVALRCCNYLLGQYELQCCRAELLLCCGLCLLRRKSRAKRRLLYVRVAQLPTAGEQIGKLLVQVASVAGSGRWQA